MSFIKMSGSGGGGSKSFVWDRLIHFILGAVCMWGLVTWFQDYYGLEEYVKYCRDHWIGLSPGWGFGIAAVALYLSVSRMRKEMHIVEARIAKMNEFFNSEEED